jgi:hypothetical protein
MTRLTCLGHIGAFFVTGLVCACAGPSAIYDKPESAYVFPNANFTLVGPAQASVTKTSFLIPTIHDPNMEQEAVREALSVKGGDNLIDARYFWTTRSFIIFYTTTLLVEGTAVTMQLGRQVPQR